METSPPHRWRSIRFRPSWPRCPGSGRCATCGFHRSTGDDDKVKSQKSKVKSQKSKVKSEKSTISRVLRLRGGMSRLLLPLTLVCAAVTLAAQAPQQVAPEALPSFEV